MALGFDLFGVSEVRKIGELLLSAYKKRSDAKDSIARAQADKEIADLEARASVARIEAADRWSARRIGSLLIVVPFGLWYGSIYIVSMVNGLFGTGFTILDVPDRTYETAMVLVPSILLAEVSDRVSDRLISIFRRRK